MPHVWSYVIVTVAAGTAKILCHTYLLDRYNGLAILQDR